MRLVHSDMHVIGVGHRPPDVLLAALVEAGCNPRVQNLSDWLQSPVEKLSPTVFALYADSSSSGAIVSRLDHYARPPVLGVFMREMAETDERLARACGDFVVWPCEQHELALRLRGACNERCLTSCDSVTGDDTLTRLNLVGRSAPFTAVVHLLRKMSACNAPILINGETGTGKEVAARAVHYMSERRNGPFIPVNCGGVPDDLLENELFGHSRGAYTDARENLPGLVEQADGGTLFLDEIGNLSARGQCALLRFLQTQEFKRLGCGKLRKANVRVIAATNADLRRMVRSAEFREDLLYRLDILSLTMPALRERGEDALLLAEHFLQKLNMQYDRAGVALSRQSRDFIAHYGWPGNVRELENLMHRAFLLTEGDDILITAPAEACGASPITLPPAQAVEDGLLLGKLQQQKQKFVDGFEQHYLFELMSHTRGNVSEAARIAGKERRALGRLLKKHGINRGEFR